MLSFPTSISYRAKINRERFGHNDFGIFVSFLKTLEVNSTFEQRQKLGWTKNQTVKSGSD